MRRAVTPELAAAYADTAAVRSGKYLDRIDAILTRSSDTKQTSELLAEVVAELSIEMFEIGRSAQRTIRGVSVEDYTKAIKGFCRLFADENASPSDMESALEALLMDVIRDSGGGQSS